MIEHRSQINQNTCVSACLAMILNKDVWTVVREFHYEYSKGNITVAEYLDINRCAYTLMDSVSRIDGDGVYLAVVSSLNSVGGLHQVVLEVVNGVVTVHDPNFGREGLLYYSTDKFDNFAVKFDQYVLDLKVVGGDYGYI